MGQVIHVNFRGPQPGRMIDAEYQEVSDDEIEELLLLEEEIESFQSLYNTKLSQYMEHLSQVEEWKDSEWLPCDLKLI